MPDEPSGQDDDQLDAADRLFAEAIELPAGARKDYVLAAPGFSSRLRHSVLKLLCRFEEMGDFLERPAGREFLPGKVLADRFEIIERIGRGGMGDVYLAQDRGLGEKVALKTIRAEWHGDDSMFARFREEIKLARRVGHPNVCKTYDLFSESNPDGTKIAFFTMEYLPGESLAEAMKRTGRMKPAEVLRIAGAIAAGLDAAHCQGVIHRDLKPSNVILAAEGLRPVITDFGLAKALDGKADSQTQTGMIVGSPDYMAPEQFLGNIVTPKADVFAFALIFFEMSCGARPWPAETFLRAAMRRVSAAPSRLRDVAPELPWHWDGILQKALLANPALRHASAGALVAELNREHSAIRAALTRVRPPELSKLSRRHLVAGGIAAISVSGTVTYFRLHDQAGPKSPIVMLSPVTSSTNPPAVKALDFLLEQSLQQSAHLRVLPKGKLAPTWTRMGRTWQPSAFSPEETREIALRLGAEYVLFSELAWTNGEWAIRANLERMGSSPLHARSVKVARFYATDERGLITAAAQAVEWVRGACGESAGEIAVRSHPPEDVTTSSWEALKEYVAANEAWSSRPTDREWPPDQRQTAEDHLTRALEIDPQFARAAAALADIQVASLQFDEGLLNYERAANLMDKRNLTDRESLSIRGLFSLDSGQYAKAEQIFRRFAEEYPDTGLPLFYEARAIECLGNAEGGLHLIEMAIKREPENYTFRMERALRCLRLGRFPEAQKECDRAAGLNPSDWTAQARSALAFSRKDLRGAWRELEQLKANGSVSFRGKALILQGCLRAEQKREDEAQRLLEESLEFDRVQNQPASGSVKSLGLLASLLISRGRYGDAAEACRTILRTESGLKSTLDAGALLAQAGALKEARACLPKGVSKDPPSRVPESFGRDAARQLIEFPVYFRRILRLWAELALAEGEPKIAYQLMLGAPPAEASQAWPDTLVRAAIASGEVKAAEGKLTALFGNPAAYWVAPDVSPPGFMRGSIAKAQKLKMAASLWSPLERLLNQSTD